LLKTEYEWAKILIAAGKNIDPEPYPNLLKVIAISWARNSLDSSLAGDLMLPSMNKNLLKRINLDKVLDGWVNQKSRIVQFK
jgi:hypothetical protein